MRLVKKISILLLGAAVAGCMPQKPPQQNPPTSTLAELCTNKSYKDLHSYKWRRAYIDGYCVEHLDYGKHEKITIYIPSEDDPLSGVLIEVSNDFFDDTQAHKVSIVPNDEPHGFGYDYTSDDNIFLNDYGLRNSKTFDHYKKLLDEIEI